VSIIARIYWSLFATAIEVHRADLYINDMEKPRPDICQAKNHQIFLKASFDFIKSKNPKISHGYCAKKLSVASSYLKNVFSGRRSLSLELVAKTATLFRLSAFERRFLTVMLIRDQVMEKDTRTYFDGVLGILRAETIQLKNNPVFKVSKEAEGPLRDPILNLLHSLVQMEGFRPDPHWIRSCTSNPNISDLQITSGYEELLRQGFLEKKNNKYVVTKEYISSPDPYNLETFRIYRAGLQEVDWALENVVLYKNCGFLMSHLLVNESDADRVLKAFNRFREEALEIEKNSVKPDRVIGISNNYLTLARAVPKSE
jgi:uncharacterized protein (TIGR02147 family)